VPSPPPSLSYAGRRFVPAAAALLALSVAGYFYVHRTPHLTDTDTIVLADFDNRDR